MAAERVERNLNVSTTYLIPSQPLDVIKALLGAIEALNGRLACSPRQHQKYLADNYVRIAGILVTLLRAFSGCTRRQVLAGAGVSHDLAQACSQSDAKRLKYNTPACLYIVRVLQALCENERHSADIKRLVYAAMPAICRANPHIEANVMQMLMSRIDAYNNNSSSNKSSFSSNEVVLSKLLVFSVDTFGANPPMCHVDTSACVELVTRQRQFEDEGSIAAVLVEPVDVLLQSLEMCSRARAKSTTTTTTTTSSDAHTRAVRFVDAMSRDYLQRGGNEHVTRLVDQHLRGLQVKCARTTATVDGVALSAEARLGLRLQCMQIAHQLELGIVEALVEHTLMRETSTKDTYANVSLLLTRHEAIRSAFSVRLEEMQRQKMTESAKQGKTQVIPKIQFLVVFDQS